MEAFMVDDWLANAYEGMSRRQFLAGMTAAGVGLAGFAVAADAVAGEIITTLTTGLTVAESRVPSGDFQVPVYEAYPSGPGRYPIVLVIPEIFGMHEHMKDVVRRFAKEGFLAITFEPYARDGGVLQLREIAEVRKVADSLPDARVMGDLDALLAYGKRHPAGRADRVGVTGFCRGGMYTLLFAARSRDVKAAVSWYGQIKPAMSPGIRTAGPLDVAGRINAPFLASTVKKTWVSLRPTSRRWKLPSKGPAKRQSSCSTPRHPTPSLRTTGRVIGRRLPKTAGPAASRGSISI